MTIFAVGCLLGGWLLMLPPATWGARELPGDANHRGVVDSAPYQIFPENRPGNAVYLENRLIFTTSDETILELLPLPMEGRFAYTAAAADGSTRVGLYLQPNDRQLRLDAVSASITHAVVLLDGVVYKKLYRLSTNGLQDLLPASRTPDGVVTGPRGVVFYHVASVTEPGPLPGAVKKFGLRLHVALFDEDRVRNLGYLVTNTRAAVDLVWRDADHIAYTLADRRSLVVNLSQFR